MRDGCAGFFTAEELAAGKGIVPRPLDSRPRPGVRPDDWTDLVPLARASLDDAQVDALRRGDLVAAFGPPFERLALADPLPLPGGRMTLVHRVETLDPAGGRFGLGLIRAEADIHPDDWFMVCHFVDDRVMPGTLMYECCLHTLRIFLMRLGWVGARGEVAFEPVPGVASRLRCRGQVVESTRKVTYEVTIKELGYGPEPYAIADALMYADGKPIVEITDMALRLTGTDRATLERLWRTGESLSRPAPDSASSGGAGQPRDRALEGADPRLRDRQALRRVRRALPPVRRRPVHRPAASPPLPVPGPGDRGGRRALGDGRGDGGPGRVRHPARTPGTSRPTARIAFPTPSCWKRRSSRAAGWPPTWARP